MNDDPAVMLRALASGRSLERTLSGTEDAVVIGRGSASTWRLDEPLLSRLHLRLEWKDGVLLATDLGSRNGSRRNTTPLAGPTRLAHGDMLLLARVTIEIAIPSSREDLTVARPSAGAPGALPVDRTDATRSLPPPARRGPAGAKMVVAATVLCASIATSWVWNTRGRVTSGVVGAPEPPRARAVPHEDPPPRQGPAPVSAGELSRDAVGAYALGRRREALRLFEELRARDPKDAAVGVVVRVIGR